ncbi:hypothetical protein RAB80_002230 [Fusarium oxysporum f. sp. vasinfectum]|nr:hypothetical protein RAB80_010178 [Fusarium oxysporum f. sp. vasinfectum]KAK2680437.1 hypothetical protein RAB80_002230 [Fusarium oxysporum f. sp. vasinfectum]KAK2931628.1 hypothetical protein FoTM2_009144 [Fusarium oxysporum f. sp. vasinfectum]
MVAAMVGWNSLMESVSYVSLGRSSHRMSFEISKNSVDEFLWNGITFIRRYDFGRRCIDNGQKGGDTPQDFQSDVDHGDRLVDWDIILKSVNVTRMNDQRLELEQY